MLVVIGFIVVLVSVLGGFVLSHGKLIALFQPFEWLIICGAAFGAFLAANSGHSVAKVFKAMPRLIVPGNFHQRDYLQLLACLYQLFAVVRRDGYIAIEDEIENPKAGKVFSQYPLVLRNPKLLEFITDYLRLMIIGDMTAHELENLIDVDLDTRLEEDLHASHALGHIAEGLPGFGIVAAVLGIVITMQQLGSGKPEELGYHIAAALVGTLTGILLAYGFVGPMSHRLDAIAQEDAKVFECIKVSLLATLNGMPPQVAVEFARKTLYTKERPTFAELESAVRRRR
jgi:chemotaxis protein MotA